MLNRLDGSAEDPIDGGAFPRWSPDGTRLYCESQGRVMEVDIDLSGGR